MTQSVPVHCYTNPSFCQQSEYISENRCDELPPPPQFQSTAELPPTPPPPPPPPPPISTPIPIQHQQQQSHNYQIQHGHTNPGFQTRLESDLNEVIDHYAKTPDRYCYLDENSEQVTVIEDRKLNYNKNTRSRYEYINDDDDEPPPPPPIEQRQQQQHQEQLQRRASLSQFETISHHSNQQFVRHGSYHGQQLQGLENRDNTNHPRTRYFRQNGNNNNTNIVGNRYAVVPNNNVVIDNESTAISWMTGGRSSPRGRYARVPMQEDDPPSLPERNSREQIELRDNNTFSSRNNLATIKLHEILTTPRKPRSKSEDRNLSPRKIDRGTPQRNARYTPPISATTSPSGRGVIPGSSQRGTPIGTPQRTFSPNRPTSTPNKGPPSARRCLPLDEQQEICPASNCGRTRYSQRHGDSRSLATSPTDFSLQFNEPPPRYAYVDSHSDSMPMVIGSPKYQVLSSSRSEQRSPQKRSAYDSVESAFMARTAVVPPLSSQNSEMNTTLASGIEKNERKNAPLLLVLVGILTSGLALYLSWTQGRKYYLDSATGCGVCCALAGASRSLRRTWTGLGLAGLSAVSCAGLLLLAAKSPRPGTPLHDITAGALCGVSLLGAGLALVALIAPRCSFGRHRRVHSWMPRFSP